MRLGSKFAVLASIALGWASPLWAQQVSLHFEADRSVAIPGERITWTVSASFSGYDDPTAYFGSFNGSFRASDPLLGQIRDPEPLLSQSGAAFPSQADLIGVSVGNTAILGEDDPSNPIAIFRFDVLVSQDFGASTLSYDADGIARVYPDNAFATPADAFESFEVVSDSVEIRRPPEPSVALSIAVGDSAPGAHDLVPVTVAIEAQGLGGFPATIDRVAFDLVSDRHAGTVTRVRTLIPSGLSIDPNEEPRLDRGNLIGVSLSASPGVAVPTEPTRVLRFDLFIAATDGVTRYRVENASLRFLADGLLYTTSIVGTESSPQIAGPGKIAPDRCVSPGPLLLSNGNAFAVTDDLFIVGRPSADGAETDTGDVVILDKLSGEIVTTLTATLPNEYDRFGSALDVSGDLLAVLAEGALRDGSVALFDLNTLAHTETIDLFAGSASHPGAEAIDLEGGLLVTGSPSSVGPAGVADVWDLFPATLRHEFLPPPPAVSIRFAEAVATDGEIVAVGYPESRSRLIVYDAATGAQLADLSNASIGSRSISSIALTEDLIVWATRDDDYPPGSVPDSQAFSPGRGFAYDRTSFERRFTLTPGDVLTAGSSAASAPGVLILSGLRKLHAFDQRDGRWLGDLGQEGTATDEERVAVQGQTVWTIVDGDSVCGFPVPTPPATSCSAADLARPFGVLDLGDVSAFLEGFGGGDPIVDFNSDRVLDLADLIAFVGAFVAGCP